MNLSMPGTRRRFPHDRLIPLAAVLALAVPAGACGGSDEGSGSKPSAATTTTTDTSPATTSTETTSGDSAATKRPDRPKLTGDRAEAAKGAVAVEEVYDSIDAAAAADIPSNDVPVQKTIERAESNAGLAKMCSLMSERAKRQTITFADRTSGLADAKWSCEAATGMLLRRIRQSGGLKSTLRAKVVRVDARGNRATVTIKFNDGKGPASQAGLVRENGEWKLAASPAG